MDAQYLSALEETLKQIQTPDSNVIKQATKRLNSELLTNSLALPALIHILQNSSDETSRQLAAVEARKIAINSWDKVDAQLKPEIRNTLLNSAFNEPVQRIRHSSARIISAISEIDLDNGEWSDLLPNLVNAIEGSDSQVKETAVFTLYTILETQVPALLEHVPGFLKLFSQLLADPSSRDIRVNAVLSLDVLSQFIEQDAEIDAQQAQQFKTTIPGMVDVLKDVIASDDDEKVKTVFNVFNSLIFLDNKLVGEHLTGLIQFIAEISANTQLNEEYRVFGLQFLISCVSMKKSKIISNKLGPQITLIAARIASEPIDIEDELNNEDEENENEENSPPNLALRLVAILSAELPPSQTITPFFENLSSMLSSSNQFERRAALLIIGVASSGAPDYFSTQIGKIIPVLSEGLKDSETIVRVAALKSLSQLTSELQDIVAEHHEVLLPLIINIIDNATSVMTYKNACYALDGLIEFMSFESISKYVEPLMNKLFGMLQQANSSSLRAAIVSAIGSTAFASGKSFQPFFDTSIQLLEPFVSNVTETEGMSEEDIELRALTFENISTMARAVGSGNFSNYATPLVDAAYISLQSSVSRIRESGFAFISNMAKVYGSEFAGFLDKIVPEIFKCLEQEEFTFNVEGDDAEDEDEEEDLDNKFHVHTGITIEKEIASVALSELALGTGKAFAKYVEPSIKSLADQIENSYGMREASLNALWKIVKAMFVASYGEKKAPKGVPQSSFVEADVLQLIKQVREITIQNLGEEFELTMVACILDNFSDAINSLGPIAVIDNASETEQLENLCVQLMNILKKEHPCQAEEFEEEEIEEEEASETDALLFESALEVLISLATSLEGDFNKVFTSFKDVISSNVNSKSKNMRVSAIGALAEISAGVKSSNPYSQELLEVFSERLSNDKSLDVKGNSAYGIGIVIENSDVDFSSAYPSILNLLFDLLGKTDKQAGNVDADDEETQEVVNRSYANACGCVARLALKNEAAVPLEHVIQPLLSHLPLKTALEENVPIFKLIIKLFEKDDQLINSQVEAVVNIFAEAFTKEFERIKLLEGSTLGREENLDRLKQFQNDELKQQVINLLKFLDQKFGGAISSNEVLKSVIA